MSKVDTSIELFGTRYDSPIGRPYLWGLGAFGQQGVERVLEIVRTETRAAMQQCGARSVKELDPGFVRRAT